MKPTRIKIFALSALFAIAFSSCEKFAKDTPSAIKKLIREKEQSCLTEVTEFLYDNKYYIYTFHTDNCDDAFSYTYDEKGRILCQSGGAAGFLGCKEILEKSIKTRTVWTRKKQKTWKQKNI
ncbi:MAG: hypothetical protein LBH82_00835 [Bacteroidales bacterium]|jgi:hypothetical protein|nr:hypothetical protein [Bacteroidales bacterium]